MIEKSFNKFYSKVPAEQREQLEDFRRRCPLKSTIISGVTWEYYSCGRGSRSLLLLAGGARFADVWFRLITSLEHEYQIIAITDPGVPTVSAFTNAVTSILDMEQVERTHVLGTSLGGVIAQCLVRVFPERVDRLVLSNTFTTDAIPRRATRFALKLASLFPTRLLQLAIKWNMLSVMSTSRSNRDFWKAFWEEKTHTHLLRLSRDEAISQHKLVLDIAAQFHFSANDTRDWAGTVGLITSDDDIGFIRRDFDRLCALYPRAKVVTLHAVGHTPGYTLSREYAAVVKELLSSYSISPTE